MSKSAEMRRKIVAIAVDEGGLEASDILGGFLLKSGDDVHILSVRHKVPGQMVQMPSGFSIGENYGSVVNEEVYQHTKRDEEERVDQLLQGVSESPLLNNFCPKVHALDPIGGASGVAESLVQWCRENNADFLCLGMREQSGFGSMLMSLLGFGSVSKYSMNKLKIPVCILHRSHKLPNEKRKIAICMNGAESIRCLHWVCQNIVSGGEEVHIISVALKAPYDIIDEDSISSHVLSNREHDEDDKELHYLAERSIEDSLKIIQGYTVQNENVICKVLEPREEFKQVADSIKKYTEENGIDLVCLGRRNLSPIKRTLDTWFGLGSVSDWCASHLTSSILIVPENESDSST